MATTLGLGTSLRPNFKKGLRPNFRKGLRPIFVIVVCGAAVGLEHPEQWRTAPDLLAEFAEPQLWLSRTTTFATLAGGAVVTEAPGSPGRPALRWADHPRWPTISTTAVPHDWSAARSVVMTIHSAEATGEKITLGFVSDSPQTPWRDLYLFTFAVDWTGWQTVNIPLTDFDPDGQPAGWGKVDEVFLATKARGHQPNPYTVLTLVDLQPSADEAPSRRVVLPPEAGRLPVARQIPEFDPSVLNHAWPETRDGQQVTAPIQYEAYFRAERALFGYFPRFQPGFVSFATDGRAYLVYGSGIVQWLDDAGRWVYRDLNREVIEPYARETLGFAALTVVDSGQVNDPTIRFDSDGDAYALAFVEDPTKDWRSRTGLLLHSRDALATWSVYRLPYYMARFEKLGAHNRDALRRPPVILLSTYFAPATVYLTIPEKQADGSLVIPEPVRIADQAMPFIPHSGEAANAVTVGDRVFVAYGRVEPPPGHAQEDGSPSYAVVYDIPTHKLSEPVLIGFGGKNAKDDHNWPAIAVDGDGYFHAILNGHHDPFVSTRSVRPLDISAWTPPEKVAEGTSYAGLVIDRHNTLYAVSRCAEPGYYFRLSLHRRRAGAEWEPPRHLVIPFKPYYKVWFHKLTIDPATDRLFLAYWSQSPSECLFKDEFLAYLHTWPDREREFLSAPDARPPLGTALIEPRRYEFYGAPPSELTILVSDDRGETWRLATTPDFVRHPAG